MGRTTLYDNSTGSNANIPLSYSSANYDFLDIYFTGESKTDYSHTRVYSPSGKSVGLQQITPNTSTRTYIRRTRYAISGTSISVSGTVAAYVDINSGTVTHRDGGVNHIYITHVDGWNY